MDKSKIVEYIKDCLREELAAGVPADRQAQIERLATVYRFLPLRTFAPDEVIAPTSLVELELNGRIAFYFLVPSGGGLIARIDGKPVQVITSRSPLGELLVGKKAGDRFKVETESGVREYCILSHV